VVGEDRAVKMSRDSSVAFCDPRGLKGARESGAKRRRREVGIDEGISLGVTAKVLLDAFDDGVHVARPKGARDHGVTIVGSVKEWRGERERVAI